MTFQSAHFFVFLCAVVLLNWLLRARPAARKNMLLAASYYFYMAWDWRFASVLIGLTLVNFAAGRVVARAEHERERRLALAAALVLSLGALAFFKYADFFADELRELLASLGWIGDGSTLRIVLPIGISFFTFQSLSYVLDVYRRQEHECTDLRDFALFVAFFPTVLAGPITRARQLLPQFAAAEPPTVGGMEYGLALVVRGLVKKVVFADVLASHLVAPAFESPASFSPWFLLLALYAYTFQIYMDVSGYTDIARGAAAMCGWRLPENFDRPYIASTVSNFWQRWHISMSSFFRDYLYFGLGGSQRGNVYFNLMLTFVAIGIWHGAGWNFVLYGLLHGGAVCTERWWRGRRTSRGLSPVPEQGLGWLVGVFVTFHFVVFSRVLFRAPDLTSAAEYLRQLLTSTSTLLPIGMQGMATLAIAAIVHWFFPRAGIQSVETFKRMPVPVQALGMLVVVYLLMALSVGTAPFVYFQF